MAWKWIWVALVAGFLGMTAGVQRATAADNDLPQVQIGAFGDADYQLLGSPTSFPTLNDFSLGDAAVVVKARYGDHLRLLDENLVEFDGPEPSIGVDRFMVTYIFSDELRLSAGRDHLAIGHWIRTYNYAAENQLTINRPFFLNFEDDGGVVPVHIMGLTAEGLFNLGGSSLKYELNLGNRESVLVTGNGSGQVLQGELNDNASGDVSSSKAAAARLVFKPWADGGFSIGVASAWNRSDAIAETGDLVGSPLVYSDLGQVILEGEMVYSSDNFDLFGEFYEFDDQIAGFSTQGSSNNYAFYVQMDGQPVANLWPYVRMENMQVAGSDPYFQALLQRDETLYLLGFRFDIEPKVTCFKLEGQMSRESAAPFSPEVDAQWAFGF
jgi:hypothetical protein